MTPNSKIVGRKGYFRLFLLGVVVKVMQAEWGTYDGDEQEQDQEREHVFRSNGTNWETSAFANRRDICGIITYSE